MAGSEAWMRMEKGGPFGPPGDHGSSWYQTSRIATISNVCGFTTTI